MSRTTRAPPPVDGGLPSLGLLSLKETRVDELERHVAKVWNSIEDGLISLEKDPVAAKASMTVHKLELTGEEGGSDRIDYEDVSTQARVYTGEKKKDKSLELWDAKYPDGEARRRPDENEDRHKVPFKWENVYEAMRTRKANGPWRLFYRDHGTKEEYMAREESAWTGWSPFSPVAHIFSLDSRDDFRDVFYETAHYLADPNSDENAKNVLALYPGLKYAFSAGCPRAVSAADLVEDPYTDYVNGTTSFESHVVETTCRPLFDWISNHSRIGRIAAQKNKTQQGVSTEFKENLLQFLEAKAELPGAEASLGDVADSAQVDERNDKIKATKKKIDDAQRSLLHAFDNFKDIPNSRNPCPMPPGCLRHEHLRPGGTVDAIARNGLTQNVYVGVRLNDWRGLLERPPNRKGFYSTKSQRLAWGVFLGISTTSSKLDPNVRARSRDSDTRTVATAVMEADKRARQARTEGTQEGAAAKRKKEDTLKDLVGHLEDNAYHNDASREITDEAIERWMEANREKTGDDHLVYMALVGTATEEEAKEYVRQYLKALPGQEDATTTLPS